MDVGTRKFGLVVLAVALLAVPATAQDGFEVDITEENTVVNPSIGETAMFKVDVTNTGDTDRRFRVSFETGTATDPGWYSGPHPPFLGLEPGETRTSTLYVTPDLTAVAGRMGPEIVVYTLDDPDNQYSELVSFSVTRDRDIQITQFEGPEAAYDPGENLSVSMTIKNVIQRDIASNQYRLILEMNGRRVTKGVPAMEAGETEQIDAAIDLTGYSAGVYNLDVRVKEIDGDVHSTQEARVEVRAKESFETNRSQKNRFLTSRRKVTMMNDGNTVIEDANVSGSVVWYLSPFLSYSTEPDTVASEGGQEVFTWSVERLEPGESVTYTYTLNYWSLALVVVILLGAAVLVLRQYRTVTIVKSGREAGDQHSIHLRVKNKTGSEIKEVTVEDFVPGIASLIEKFDSRSPEKIQGTDEGTKMVWKLGRMDPGEERIITYRVRPRVQVEGYVSLPEATVTYEKGGKESEQQSHPVSADFS